MTKILKAGSCSHASYPAMDEVTILVANQGKIFAKRFRRKKDGNCEKIDYDNVFWIGSTTKPVTGACQKFCV